MDRLTDEEKILIQAIEIIEDMVEGEIVAPLLAESLELLKKAKSLVSEYVNETVKAVGWSCPRRPVEPCHSPELVVDHWVDPNHPSLKDARYCKDRDGNWYEFYTDEDGRRCLRSSYPTIKD